MWIMGSEVESPSSLNVKTHELHGRAKAIGVGNVPKGQTFSFFFGQFF